MNYSNHALLSSVLLPSLILSSTATAQEVAPDPLRINIGVYEFKTGEFQNDHGVLQLRDRPSVTSERLAQPVFDTIEAPSTLNFSLNTDAIVEAVQAGADIEGLNIDLNSVEARLSGQVDRTAGAHLFGPGVEVTGSDGVTSSAYVAGDGVRFAPDGTELEDSAVVTFTTGLGDGNGALVRVRHLENGDQPATVNDSGVWWGLDDEGNDFFVVEDLNPDQSPDDDYNDNRYSLVGGEATFSGQTVEQFSERTDTVSEWERQPDPLSDRLGHLDENNKGTDTLRLSIGIDGNGTARYQLAPIGEARPLLLSIGADIDFGAGVGESTADINASAVQYLTRTVRGVETTTSEIVATGDAGINLDAQYSGRGDSAYTDNVGVVRLDYTDGRISYIPMWSKHGIVGQELLISADRLIDVTPGIIPQQANSDWLNGKLGIEISQVDLANADLAVIDIVGNPANFNSEAPNRYGMEDTIANTQNTAIPDVFNGVASIYEGVATDDHNDGFIGWDVEAKTETIETTTVTQEIVPAAAYGFVGIGAGLGEQETTTQIDTFEVTDRYTGSFGINEAAGVENVTVSLDNTETLLIDSSESSDRSHELMPVVAEAGLGVVHYFNEAKAYQEGAAYIETEVFINTDDVYGVRGEVAGHWLYATAQSDNRDVSVTGGVRIGF